MEGLLAFVAEGRLAALLELMTDVVKAKRQHGSHDQEAQQQAEHQGIVCIGPGKIEQQPAGNHKYRTVGQAVPGCMPEILPAHAQPPERGIGRKLAAGGVEGSTLGHGACCLHLHLAPPIQTGSRLH